MRKKNRGWVEDLFGLMMLAPWWLGPALAGISFLIFRFLLPAILGAGGTEPLTKSMGYTLGSLSYMGAWVPPALLLMIWGVAEANKYLNRWSFAEKSSSQDIRKMSWEQFESLVGEAYRRQGYVVRGRGGAGADGGVDLELSGNQQRVLVQCKQWKARRVGVRPIRELFGVVTSEGADTGILVTSGEFTSEAKDFADRSGLTLIDGAELQRLISSAKMEQSLVGIVQTPREPRPADSNARPDLSVPPAEAVSPICPQCKASMVLRTARKGAGAGRKFWGCPGYPRCRGTRPHN